MRGFASYKMLSGISKSNSEIQRDLNDKHRGDMARYLNAGKHRFFPEVILSTSLTDGVKDFEELDLFHTSLWWKYYLTRKTIRDLDFFHIFHVLTHI